MPKFLKKLFVKSKKKDRTKNNVVIEQQNLNKDFWPLEPNREASYKTKNELLEQQLKELEAANYALVKENDSLFKEAQKKEAEYFSVFDDITSKRMELHELDRNYTNWKALNDNEKFKHNRDWAIEKNQRLRKENKDMVLENKSLQANINALELKNKELKDQIKSLGKEKYQDQRDLDSRE